MESSLLILNTFFLHGRHWKQTKFFFLSFFEQSLRVYHYYHYYFKIFWNHRKTTTVDVHFDDEDRYITISAILKQKKKILCTQFQKCFLSFFFSYWESTVCVCVCVLVYEWCAHIKKNLKFNSHFGCILGANLIQRKKTVKILLLKPSKQTNNQKKNALLQPHLILRCL